VFLAFLSPQATPLLGTPTVAVAVAVVAVAEEVAVGVEGVERVEAVGAVGAAAAEEVEAVEPGGGRPPGAEEVEAEAQWGSESGRDRQGSLPCP
jgi:hypothetical protein